MSKHLNKTDFSTNLNLRNFEDQPFMNGFETLGTSVDEKGTINLINALYNISAQEDEFVTFVMDYSGGCTVTHFKQGDEVSLKRFTEFQKALDYFYGKCYTLRHPEDKTYIGNNF